MVNLQTMLTLLLQKTLVNLDTIMVRHQDKVFRMNLVLNVLIIKINLEKSALEIAN